MSALDNESNTLETVLILYYVYRIIYSKISCLNNYDDMVIVVCQWSIVLKLLYSTNVLEFMWIHILFDVQFEHLFNIKYVSNEFAQ